MNEIDKGRVSDAYRGGLISRRDAAKQLLTAGLSAPTAYAALGALAPQTSVAQDAFAKAITKDLQQKIQAQAETMARFASSPEVLSQISSIQGSTDKVEAATKVVASIYQRPKMESLAKSLNTSLEELRLAVRVFEAEEGKTLFRATLSDFKERKPSMKIPPGSPTVNTSNVHNQFFEEERFKGAAKKGGVAQKPTVCASIGVILCGSVGTEME